MLPFLTARDLLNCVKVLPYKYLRVPDVLICVFSLLPGHQAFSHILLLVILSYFIFS